MDSAEVGLVVARIPELIVKLSFIYSHFQTHEHSISMKNTQVNIFLGNPIMKNISVILPFRMLLARYSNALSTIVQPAKVSLEFLQWRHQLLLNRLPWLIGVTLIALLMIIFLNLFLTIPSLNASGDPKLAFGDEKLYQYFHFSITQILGLLLCVVLLKHQGMRHHPQRLFLLVSFCLLLTPQIISTIYGNSHFDPLAWILFYAIQAILIPVHWQLHLLSQVIVIGYFTLMMILGFRDPDVTLAAGYWVAGFYTALICIVANLGVFLYESALKREFDLRQQLRVFLHAVSHDLRNPVLGMVMTLKTFVNSSGEDAKISQELLEQLIAGGDRQFELINSLLEAHSTEIHGINLHRQPIAIDNLLNSVITDFQPFFQQAKTTISQNISSGLPLVNADPLHLRRVYENLISNALKYNRPGLNLNFSIEIFTTKSKIQGKNHWLRCTVTDNGIGMTQQQCDHLFDLYTREPNRRQSLSLGLGLYMCRLIIMAHGGKIGITSNPGHGSTFWFTLPVQ
ncbi:MAG TPA: HAMP domain-containing sensor histidine kinase [Nostocaceae cyanobacterium]|nr:HAMP domain-containing sensor histidine kinase [Nostocaceae cyanobacterium]